LSRFKKYHSPGNLKFDFLGILQSLKLLINVEKILSISLKLNFTPNALGSDVSLKHVSVDFKPKIIPKKS